MVLILDVILSGVRSSIGAFKPPISTIVTMNISFVSATSLLNRPSFCKTTFQLGLFKSPKKNTYVVWIGKFMKGSNVRGNLCKKYTIRNPTSSLTYVGFPWLFFDFIHLHLKMIIRVCIGP